jgi:hypothetical protein
MIPAYAGPVPEGEKAVSPYKAFGAPVADMTGILPYLALQGMFDAAYPKGRRNYWKSAVIPELSDAMIDILQDGYASTPSPFGVLFLEQVGGAVNRVGVTDTAFPHRNATYNFMITTAWEDPAEDDPNIRWVRSLWSELSPYLGDGVYVNYLSERGLEGENRVRAAYGPNYDRLVALKQQYDPENRFRHNQNIVPVAS